MSDDDDEWIMGDYNGEACEHCGRVRVCVCTNGRRRCEKCNLVPEDGAYCPEPMT